MDLFENYYSELMNIKSEMYSFSLSPPLRNHWEITIDKVKPYLKDDCYIPFAIKQSISSLIIEFFPEQQHEDPFLSFQQNKYNQNISVTLRKELKKQFKMILQNKTHLFRPKPKSSIPTLLCRWKDVRHREDLFDGRTLRDDLNDFLSQVIEGDLEIRINKKLQKPILVSVPTENAKIKIDTILSNYNITDESIKPLIFIDVNVKHIPSFHINHE